MLFALCVQYQLKPRSHDRCGTNGHHSWGRWESCGQKAYRLGLKKILAGPHFIFLVLRNFKCLPVLHHKIMKADGSWFLAGSLKSHCERGIDQGAHLLTWEGGILSIVCFVCGFCFPGLLLAPLWAHEERVCACVLFLSSHFQFSPLCISEIHLGSHHLPYAHGVYKDLSVWSRR